MRNLLSATVLLITSQVAVSAQTQPVKLPAGDTLHYEQTMKLGQTMEGGPMGTMQTSVSSSMRIAVALGTNDTVRVWVESATANVSSPAGDMSPPMDQLLNKPFVMARLPNGKFKTVSSPKIMGDDPMGMSALMPDDGGFDFGMKLPAEALRPGVTWTDTTDTAAKPDSPQKVSVHAVTTNRVVGDSTIDGRAVVIVDFTVRSTTSTDMTVGNGMIMKGKSEDAGSGRVYYAPALGMIVRRDVTTDGKGTQNIEGPMTMSMTVTQKNVQTTRLVH